MSKEGYLEDWTPSNDQNSYFAVLEPVEHGGVGGVEIG